jgi:hypothetical protein
MRECGVGDRLKAAEPLGIPLFHQPHGWIVQVRRGEGGGCH